jgi:F-type H+-transporting ATPase subunit b
MGYGLLLGAALLLAAPAASAEASATEGGGHAAAAGGGGHGGGHATEMKLNWLDFSDRHTAPVVALVVNFALLLWLLIHFGRRPVREYLTGRRRKVEEEIGQADEEKVRAEGRLRGAVTRTKHLEDELQHLRDDVIKVGNDERDRMIADAGARADKFRREAEAQAVELERQAAREMRVQMVEQALDAARHTLQERLSPADQGRLADEFLRRLPSQGAETR